VRPSRNHRPPAPGPRMDFVTVKHVDEKAYLILGTQIFGAWIHYVGGSSKPCHQPDAECERCDLEQPRRWVGYLHAVLQGGKDDFFLSIPPFAGYNLIQSLGQDYNLRGRILHIRRKTDHPQSRLLIRWEGGDTTRVAYIREKDPSPYVGILFHKWDRLTTPEKLA